MDNSDWICHQHHCAPPPSDPTRPRNAAADDLTMNILYAIVALARVSVSVDKRYARTHGAQVIRCRRRQLASRTRTVIATESGPAGGSCDKILWYKCDALMCAR